MSLVETGGAGAVATLILNRPDARNALSIELCDALVEALQALESDQDVRAVVIAGAGKVFCSGADFTAVSGSDGVDFLPAFERMLETVARFRLPTIAAIHGAALGGGFQLATVCDFRICTDDARLGIPSARLGILVNFENVQRLVLMAGVAVAKEMLMSARTYRGAEAAARGLVDRSVPPEELATAVEELAAGIGSLSPLSVQGTKRSIQAVVDHLGGARSSNPASVSEIDELVAAAYSSEDLQEGLRAMNERREPRFKGH